MYSAARSLGAMVVVCALSGVSFPLSAQIEVTHRQTLQPDAEDIESAPEFSDIRFGDAVAVSGKTAMVGMPSHNVIGRVAVYIRGDGWQRTATLLPSNANDSAFGSGIDLDGDTAVIASQGAAYVFTHHRSEWQQKARLVSPSRHRTLQAPVEHQHGLIAVAASGENVPGAVYVYERSRAGTIRNVAKLMASDGFVNDRFGASLALEGDILVVGAPGDSSSPGAAYVFARRGPVWVERQKLVGSDAFLGGEFGAAVAIRNRIIIVGAPRVDLPASGGDFDLTSEGNAYVFMPHRNIWFESQKLNESEPGANFAKFFSFFGTSIAMSQKLVAISAPVDVPVVSFAVGHTYLFTWQGRLLVPANSFEANRSAGTDLDLSRQQIIIGKPGPTLAGPPIAVGAADIMEFATDPSFELSSDESENPDLGTW